MRLALAALLGLVHAASAHAEIEPSIDEPSEPAIAIAEPVSAPAITMPDHAASGPDADVASRSPVLAGLLSFGLPIAAIAVVPVVDTREFDAHGAAKTAWRAAGWSAIGLFVAAPTFGALYAGDPWNSGTKIRVGGAALFALGTVLVITEPNPSSASFSFTPREAAGTLLGLIGGVSYLTGMVSEGVHSIRVAARTPHPPRATVSAGAVHGSTQLVPAVIVSGAW